MVAVTFENLSTFSPSESWGGGTGTGMAIASHILKCFVWFVENKLLPEKDIEFG